MGRIKIVAEIGCNHNGDKEIAGEMMLRAKECGVDAVKFQTFQAGELISRYAPKAEYQKATTGTEDSQLEMTQKLELSHEDYLELKQYALENELEVFSTPFDMSSIDFLYASGQSVWKIPSGEITNLPYLQKIGALKCENKQIILSTGMATMEEISKCIAILIAEGTSEGQVTLLHCNTEYPTPDIDVNLLAIEDLKAAFPSCSVGFSDHSVGTVAAVGAAVLGISMIEKHFTLDKNLPGPDHRASATPEELKYLCDSVRRIETMVGTGQKTVTDSERKNRIVARKSIVAKRRINIGEVFSEDNLTCKRPGNGISPMDWFNLLGMKAECSFEEDELIKHEGFPWQIP